MDESGRLPIRFFSDSAPESVGLGRQSRAHLPAQQSGSRELARMTGAQLRLSAWGQLPDRHRNEVCRQVRLRCEAFIGSVRVERGHRKTEVDRLVSEVVAHLLRATSLHRDENVMERDLSAVQTKAPSEAAATNAGPSAPPPWLASGRIDNSDPGRDARVIWLLDETCNRQALLHRYEDMRRRDRGGKWDGSGYPLVAVDAQTIEQLSGHYDPAESEANSLHAEDSRRAWAGLVHLAEHQFGAEDDVVLLVQVLAQDRETQESFGSQWPIGKIVRALNAGQSRGFWTDDRVENAKRRLTKFILRFKQEHGLDAVDLRALLARYARQRQAAAKRSGPAK
jgi:hypothetical protein